VATFSQTELDGLISCPKEITEPPKRDRKLDGAQFRNDAKLVASNETKGEFAMFIRQNEDFPENFSIGLTYSPHDGRDRITLLRCNGKHGDFNASFDPGHPHSDFHVHHASESAMEAGHAPEKFAVKTTEYASIEEAIQYFVKTINLSLKDAQRYFPAKTQIPFDFER
jgi:hypothetical protein